MALLLENQTIFLHIPKTGGTWVKKCLLKEGLVTTNIAGKHANLSRINKFFLNHPAKYIKKSIKARCDMCSISKNSFVFCFVRNPYKWAQSFYRYQAKRNFKNWEGPTTIWGESWHPTNDINSIEAKNFDSFLSIISKKYTGFVSQMYKGYTRRSDFVGRTENLEEDLIRVLENREMVFDESKVRTEKPANTTSESGCPALASEDTIRMFCRSEQDAFEAYEYDIEDTIRDALSERNNVIER